MQVYQDSKRNGPERDVQHAAPLCSTPVQLKICERGRDYDAGEDKERIEVDPHRPKIDVANFR